MDTSQRTKRRHDIYRGKYRNSNDSPELYNGFLFDRNRAGEPSEDQSTFIPNNYQYLASNMQLFHPGYQEIRPGFHFVPVESLSRSESPSAATSSVSSSEVV